MGVQDSGRCNLHHRRHHNPKGKERLVILWACIYFPHSTDGAHTTQGDDD